MKVKILDSRITPDMLKPATEYSAGIDLRACIDTPIGLYPNDQVMVPTGIAVAIPEGFVGLIAPRSGMSTKHGIILANTVGVIDSDYRGEVKLAVWRRPKEASKFIIEPMERLAQLIVVPFQNIVEIVEELDATVRGTGGFGSTGKS
jgi:dUTP pyrophosphatase